MQAAKTPALWTLAAGFAGLSLGCAQFLADDHCTFHRASCAPGLVCSWCDHENLGCVAPDVASECIVAPYGDEPSIDATTDDSTTGTTTEATSSTGAVMTSDPTEVTDGPETSDSDETSGPESCGDGDIQDGEGCDDGNQDNTDACTNACEPASCGDGVVWAGVESCDDANQSNSDSCLNSCELASCGDGFIRVGQEECDDQNNVVGDGCYQCWQDRLVFVTGEGFKGDLGGLGGADAKCQFAAQAAQLPGTYTAWLSSGDGMPSTTMLHSQGVYKRVDGVILARGWSDFTDGLIDATISVTELGETLEAGVWTNTEASGVTANGSADCDGWTKQDFETKGRWGASVSIEQAWSNHPNELVNPTGCDANHSLYCVMQEVESP